jgi:DNA polymerase
MLTWGELEASVAACNNCGLCDGRQRVVFGAGDRSADWLFVGEGPGYHEDQQGEPFVGRSGHLLGAMMRAMGLERGKNTYITNVLKCRATDASGKDRPPTVEEAAACMPHLRNQMALIQPHIIVALGRPAAVNLLGAAPDATLASLRGKVHHIDIAGRQVGLIATYHPSYLLRTPAAKRQAWADLCMALRYKAETPARTA